MSRDLNGAAQGVGSPGEIIDGARVAIARLLNQATYFEMKRRAGLVGAAIGNSIIPRFKPPRSIRLHFVGHSFGARLVTAATAAFPGVPDIILSTLTMLQGAFSHNALSTGEAGKIRGAFPAIVGAPDGAPVTITITHTHNDEACTLLAYAIASRLSGDNAKAIGDANDVFGAMGANGALNIDPDMLAAEDAAQAFEPVKGKVNNILADAFVKAEDGIDAHNNVATPECGRLVAAAIDCG